MSTIEELEKNYMMASSAIKNYGQEHGFIPGTKVTARYRDKPEKKGIIAPYGEAWRGVDGMSVPVLLDSGVLQPWPMSDLTTQAQRPGPA